MAATTFELAFTTAPTVRGQRMLSYLPPLYANSRVMRALLHAQGLEFDLAREALADVLAQFYVATATWGLDRWEAELGLLVTPEQPTAERRAKVISRLRGTGTATIRVIKSVAESYEEGAIEVVEDYTAHTLLIQFVDTRGVPPNVEDLKAAVRAVAPAHLALSYVFRYLIVFELTATGLTVDQVTALGFTVDQLAAWRPS